MREFLKVCRERRRHRSDWREGINLDIGVHCLCVRGHFVVRNIRADFDLITEASWSKMDHIPWSNLVLDRILFSLSD